MSAADGTKNTEEPSSIPSYGALLSPTESRRAAQAQNRVIPTSHRLLIPPNQSDGLPPHEHRRRNIGALTISPNLKQGADQDDFSDSDDDIDSVFTSKERLLDKIQEFTLAYNPDRGYRATEFKFFSFSRPHMRAMHASWICYFASYFVQFSMAPILPYLQESLHLTQRDIWLTNVWMVVGCVPMQFILGSLCDTYGPRVVMVWMLVLSAIPCALSGIVVVDLNSLLILRFLMGAMDAFVPCQCWITSHFDREVGGTVMAIAGGLGATGSGFSNLVVGLLFALCVVWTGGDADLAWRLALLFPAAFALVVAYLSYYYSDDCPLGNFVDVKKAGLMMQRSAVDSFRSGVYNLNAWLLFLQYAGSCGVDITMCNGCAVYFHARFSQSIATSGAMAFLYSISAVYARALGGYISDQLGTVFSLRGRLWGQFLCMLVQGCLNIWFAKSANLVHSLIIMVVFSVLVQMSMGTCYGIVPYVDSENTGSVAGIVGAGGNTGAIILGILFMSHDYDVAMEYMGWFTVGMSLITPLIVIRGYKGILFGQDEHDDPNQKRSLMVPKMRHSPHLVKIRNKMQVNKRDPDYQGSEKA